MISKILLLLDGIEFLKMNILYIVLLSFQKTKQTKKQTPIEGVILRWLAPATTEVRSSPKFSESLRDDFESSC